MCNYFVNQILCLKELLLGRRVRKESARKEESNVIRVAGLLSYCRRRFV